MRCVAHRIRVLRPGAGLVGDPRFVVGFHDWLMGDGVGVAVCGRSCRCRGVAVSTGKVDHGLWLVMDTVQREA